MIDEILEEKKEKILDLDVRNNTTLEERETLDSEEEDEILEEIHIDVRKGVNLDPRADLEDRVAV